MKPNYRSVLSIFIVFFCFTAPIWAGIPATLTHSPSNPIAGQTVTFSVAEAIVTECEIVKVAPDLVGEPGLLLDLTLASGFYTTTYVYSNPGTYQIGYDRTYEDCETFRIPAGNKRELATFQFGPVGGPFEQATNNQGIISAPLLIGAAAPIPTMGQWGLILLALISAIFGVVMWNERYFKLARIKP